MFNYINKHFKYLKLLLIIILILLVFFTAIFIYLFNRQKVDINYNSKKIKPTYSVSKPFLDKPGTEVATPETPTQSYDLPPSPLPVGPPAPNKTYFNVLPNSSTAIIP